MTVFWLAALALVGVTLAILLPPLLRAPRSGPVDRDAALEVYRSRLAALEEEHRIGSLADGDLAQAKSELARELLADADAQTESAAGRARRRSSGPWLALAVGVGVPLLTVILYQRLGEPGGLDPTVASPPPTSGGGTVVPEVETMVARLAQRLQSEPENTEGWLMLGRSYMVLERYAEAADAYATAHRLLGDSAALLADLAEAEALRDGQNFLGIPGERLETALTLEPDHPKALWLGAFAAMQRGEAALAASRWQALLDRQPPDSEAAEILRGLIANAGVAPAPRAATSVEAAPGLTVSVTVADGLAGELDGSEVLFVFARAANGPPMPLAVVRRTSADLPLTVTLDDSMSMAPGRKLSDAGQVVIGARISSSGTATPSSGDLQGFSAPVPAAGGGPVAVNSTEKIP